MMDPVLEPTMTDQRTVASRCPADSTSCRLTWVQTPDRLFGRIALARTSPASWIVTGGAVWRIRRRITNSTTRNYLRVPCTMLITNVGSNTDLKPCIAPEWMRSAGLRQFFNSTIKNNKRSIIVGFILYLISGVPNVVVQAARQPLRHSTGTGRSWNFVR